MADSAGTRDDIEDIYKEGNTEGYKVDEHEEYDEEDDVDREDKDVEVEEKGSKYDDSEPPSSPFEEYPADFIEDFERDKLPDGAPELLADSVPLLETDDAGPEEAPPVLPEALSPTDPEPSLPKPTFPQLNNEPPRPKPRQPYVEDKNEEQSVPRSFDRTGKPVPRHQEEEEDDDDQYLVRRMYRFTLYETATRFYIVGSDLLDQQFRIMKIDRTADIGDLSVTEDETIYTRSEMMRLLATIEDGNITTGGLKQRCAFWGLLGFIRFTGFHYMLLITKRSIVAMIGGHYVYQIDSTELVPLTTESPKKPDRNSEEARFVGILGNLDLTRGFYFSYSYDITRTLQHNIIREREALAKGFPHSDRHDYNEMFAWNHYLLEPAKQTITNVYEWCMPIIHGFVDQANISVYGRTIYVTIIARRSRYFAGARFLKRGANDLGYVANDVETEQIVSEMLTTSFHAPGKNLYSNPNYTSYVQHRGSIPLFWTQKNDAATPKPPVEMNFVDPFFSAAALHFDDLFARYGAPIIVLNLVKSRERMPRESLLLKEFTQAISYLNQFLPEDKKIHYIAWDMSRAAKSRDQDVIETLETIAENVVTTTSFFHNGGSSDGVKSPQLQNGVCRTNCIDCLDRTNAAQFVIAKRALGHQLHALGVINGTSVEYDTDAVDLFTHMYHDHGDTIAVQYAGSHLVNTMETYRKINQWTSHSRDMLESFKRYYNNSFLDGQRQEAYNLFLGNYIFTQGQPMLWDLSTDYYLHHANPRNSRRRRSYTQWWTPANLEPRKLPPLPQLPANLADKPYHFYDDYWLEYYRPRAVSSFLKMFAYNLNSTMRYIPLKMTKDGGYDLSPFVPRISPITSAKDSIKPKKKAKPRKGIIEFYPGYKERSEDTPDRLRAWLELPAAATPAVPPPPSPAPPVLEAPNMAQAVERALNPTISEKEQREYDSYMSHPLNLPLVVSSEPKEVVSEFVRYVDTPRRTLEVAEEDRLVYEEGVRVPENPLLVEEQDGTKPRYMAYGIYLRTGRLKRQGRKEGRGAVVDEEAGGQE
ncbi:SacI homology domain-containing protein [Pyronema omphalodes]|nr:SacI homology domain-containing protein [Pyronema omphalodes]